MVISLNLLECLNHVDMTHKVTEGYIEKDFTPIDKLNRKVLDYIFQRGEYKKRRLISFLFCLITYIQCYSILFILILLYR